MLSSGSFGSAASDPAARHRHLSRRRFRVESCCEIRDWSEVLEKQEFNSQRERIRLELERIHKQLHVHFGAETERLFFEFLGANELGLAYQLICDHLDEYRIPISPELYRMIQSAGSHMEYEPEEYEKLKSLVGS
jgi:hypothetical protein